jgi:hypothetical protein
METLCALRETSADFAVKELYPARGETKSPFYIKQGRLVIHILILRYCLSMLLAKEEGLRVFTLFVTDFR